jgi:hypothetical protein
MNEEQFDKALASLACLVLITELLLCWVEPKR